MHTRKLSHLSVVTLTASTALAQTHAHTHIHIHTTCIHTHVCTHTHTHTHACTHIRTPTCTHTHIQMHMCTTHTHTHARTHTHTHSYAHTHTHTVTNILPLLSLGTWQTGVWPLSGGSDSQGANLSYFHSDLWREALTTTKPLNAQLCSSKFRVTAIIWTGSVLWADSWDYWVQHSKFPSWSLCW